MATELERHPIHAALYKPALFLGLPRQILIAEVTSLVAFAYGLGLQWATLGFIAFIVGVVHPGLVYVTAKDSDIIYIFMRSLRLKDYYEAQPGYRAPTLPVYPSIPKV